MLECCQKVIDSDIVKKKGLCQTFINKINKRRVRGARRGTYYPLIALDYIKFMAKVFDFIILKNKKEIALESFTGIENAMGKALLN